MADDVSVEACSRAIDDAIEFLVGTGDDPTAHNDTYLPRQPTASDARHWIETTGRQGWMIRIHGVVVGLLSLHSPCDQSIPDGFLETNTYLRPNARGRGVATAAWDLVITQLGESVRGLAGVVWVENSSASWRLEKAGFVRNGRIWFEDDESLGKSGWCDVWLKFLPPRW